MNSVNAVVPTQMLTPINSLPLKTSSQQETEIDDPLIQNVLKEFEDEFSQPTQTHHQPQQLQHFEPPQPQQVQQVQQAQQAPQLQQQVQSVQQDNLQYNKGSTKKLFNMEIAKRAVFITIALFALQYTNILKVITSKLPVSVHPYLTGKELLLNFLLTFIAIYLIFYFEIV